MLLHLLHTQLYWMHIFSALSAKSETLASEVFSSGSFAATAVASFEILSVTVVIPAVSVPIPVSILDRMIYNPEFPVREKKRRIHISSHHL